MTDSHLEPGQLLHLGATFVEERIGRALIRLPNGSKTSVRFGALRPIARSGLHLRQSAEDEGEIAWCLSCDWEEPFVSRIDAEDATVTHRSRCPAAPSEEAASADGMLLYEAVGSATIQVTADENEVNILANADGLLSLARLLEQMAAEPTAIAIST